MVMVDVCSMLVVNVDDLSFGFRAKLKRAARLFWAWWHFLLFKRPRRRGDLKYGTAQEGNSIAVNLLLFSSCIRV